MNFLIWSINFLPSLWDSNIIWQHFSAAWQQSFHSWMPKSSTKLSKSGLIGSEKLAILKKDHWISIEIAFNMFILLAWNMIESVKMIQMKKHTVVLFIILCFNLTIGWISGSISHFELINLPSFEKCLNIFGGI